MQKPTIPFAFLVDSRCRHCEKFITCGTVYILADSTSICGRCRMLVKDHYRNDAFEALAKIFRYPCNNWRSHCSAWLQWNESLIHEKECHYSGGCGFLCSHPGTFFKGKREFPKEDIRLTAVPNHILEDLKCSWCDSFLNCEPVYTQADGKSFCHRCINSNGVPPNCRRNLAYENFAKIMVFPCQYRHRGCPERREFGIGLWQHECECPHNPIAFQINQNGTKKEKGVIKTHSGHIWATITPNSQLAAPPIDPNSDINKELFKSLAKKQERHIKRANEIEFEHDSSVSINGSISTKTSAHDSEFSARDNQITPPVYIPPEDYPRRISRDGSMHSERPRPNSRESRVSEAHTEPIYYAEQQDPFHPRALAASNSFKANRELIHELKIRQNIIKKTHSIRGNGDLDPHNPYRQCNSLGELINTHNQIK